MKAAPTSVVPIGFLNYCDSLWNVLFPYSDNRIVLGIFEMKQKE